MNRNDSQAPDSPEYTGHRMDRPHHRRAPQVDKYFKIRNILNIIFMLGAIVGMGVFYFYDRTLGTIIIITAMAFKMAECCFRFIRQ